MNAASGESAIVPEVVLTYWKRGVVFLCAAELKHPLTMEVLELSIAAASATDSNGDSVARKRPGFLLELFAQKAKLHMALHEYTKAFELQSRVISLSEDALDQALILARANLGFEKVTIQFGACLGLMLTIVRNFNATVKTLFSLRDWAQTSEKNHLRTCLLRQYLEISRPVLERKRQREEFLGALKSV